MTEMVPLGHQFYRLLHSLTYICERKGAGRALPFGHMLKRWKAGAVPSLRYRRYNRLRCWRQTAQR